MRKRCASQMCEALRLLNVVSQLWVSKVVSQLWDSNVVSQMWGSCACASSLTVWESQCESHSVRVSQSWLSDPVWESHNHDSQVHCESLTIMTLRSSVRVSPSWLSDPRVSQWLKSWLSNYVSQIQGSIAPLKILKRCVGSITSTRIP